MEKDICKNCGSKTVDNKCARCEDVKKNSYSEIKINKDKALTYIGRISVVFMFISVISAGYTFVSSEMKSAIEQQGGKYKHDTVKIIDFTENEDTYENLTNQMNPKGESYSKTLEQGDYKVGVHIPEGTYRATNNNYECELKVTDNENGIHISENIDHFNEEFPDEMIEYRNIHLFNGATISVVSNDSVELDTKNAQTSTMKKLEPNVVKESFEVKDGYVSGVDFPAGTYDVDIQPVKNYAGYVKQESQNYSSLKPIYLISENLHKNVEYPEGAKISIKRATATFTTSEFNTIEEE